MEMEEGEKGKTEPSKGDAKQDATETTEVSTKMERDENEKNHMKENDGKNSVGDGKPEPEPEQKPEDEAKEKDADGKSAAEQSAKVSEGEHDIYYIMAGHAIVVVKDIILLFYRGNAVILTLR